MRPYLELLLESEYTLNSKYEFIEMYAVFFLCCNIRQRCLNGIIHLKYEGHLFLTSGHSLDIFVLTI